MRPARIATDLRRAALLALAALGSWCACAADSATATPTPTPAALPELGAAQQQQASDALHQYCLTHTSRADADAAVAAMLAFVSCVRGLVDVPTLERELEQARPRGALDEVFKKYCDKAPQLKGCIGSLERAVEPCLEAAHRPQLRAAINLTDSLLDFVCYKDGDRIACDPHGSPMGIAPAASQCQGFRRRCHSLQAIGNTILSFSVFIAEQGPECLQSKATQLQSCFNDATSGVQLMEVVDTTTAEQCRKLDTLSACAVRELEACASPTPANMAESLFRFVRRHSPCKDLPQVGS